MLLFWPNPHNNWLGPCLESYVQFFYVHMSSFIPHSNLGLGIVKKQHCYFQSSPSLVPYFSKWLFIMILGLYYDGIKNLLCCFQYIVTTLCFVGSYRCALTKSRELRLKQQISTTCPQLLWLVLSSMAAFDITIKQSHDLFHFEPRQHCTQVV